MGRPLNSRLFGDNTENGRVLQFSSAWIPGQSGPTPNCYIVKQVGTSSFLAEDPATSVQGIVTLVQTITESGQGVIAVAPQGAGVGGAIGASLGASHVTLSSGGSGYYVGNTLTLVGGVFTTPAVCTVTSVTFPGVVTGISITTPGVYHTPISGTAATTCATGTGSGDTGSNATITVTGYNLANLYLIQPGINYVAPVTVAITGGGGSGGTGTVSVTAGALSSPAIVTAGDNYTSVPKVTATSTVALQTAKKITMSEVFTFEGHEFSWLQDGAILNASYATFAALWSV